jgi:hypothetical protein
MIPSFQTLKTRITSESLAYICLHDKQFFEKADDYSRLNKIFNPEGWLEKVSLLADMIISPLVTLITCVWYGELPSIFSMISLYKTVHLWSEYIYFKMLIAELHEWTRIVKSIGGPFISTNDADYHAYVYADAMERIHMLWGTAP